MLQCSADLLSAISVLRSRRNPFLPITVKEKFVEVWFEGGRGLQLTTVFLLLTEKLKPKRIHMIVEFLGIHGFTVQTKHLTVTVPP